MPEITIIGPDQLDFREDYFSCLNQEKIEDLLDQITSILDDRLDRFHLEFQKRFHGYSPELVSGLIHLQNIKITTQHN